ncbi:MAG: hypothetical protein IT303_17205 [Dehalococcoidia bacterium]|nr:hypothetical protein [Dehalococcoidia bacterium]
MDTIQTPPDIQGLQRRLRLLGQAIAEDDREIRRLKAPFTPDGLWVTADGEVWTFRRRRPEPELRPAS